MKGGNPHMRARSILFSLIMIISLIPLLYGCHSMKSMTRKETTSTTTRAYEGAPPLVPHEIEDEGGCLGCHRLGDNDAPITPHPERANCVQCHIPQNEGVKPFVENTF